MALIETELEVINIKNLKNIKIPDYQRPYSWSVESVNTLFEDTYNAAQKQIAEYRLGTLILHKKQDIYNIVDGQQRLTTIAILGILMSVAVGAVTIYLNRTREQAMDTIASSSYDGMVNYMMEKNILLNPKGEPNSSATIDIETLFEEQYIEKPIDPYNKGTTCKGTVTVTNETSSAR